MNREEKQQAVDSFHQEIAGAKSAYLVEFAGLTVAQFMELRYADRQLPGVASQELLRVFLQSP